MNHFISNHFASAHFASQHFSGEAVAVELPGERGGGGAGTGLYKRKDLIEEENAIIMAVIQAFLEKEG